MKHNKLVFAILAFIILAVFFIYIGSILTEYPFPGHEKTLFLALFTSYVPICAALEAFLYDVKYFIELKKNKKLSTHIFNISRGVLGLAAVALYVFKAFIQSNIYFAIVLSICGIIAALFAAELVMWLVSLKNKKA